MSCSVGPMGRRRRMMVLAAMLASITSCSVGKGVGAVKGKIFELGCNKHGDYAANGVVGTELDPVGYDLHPTFFAGEPIDDLRNYSSSAKDVVMSNRLIIRLQQSGKQIELNDVLTFDIASSYEVARCVRGHINDDGSNDWDETNCYRAAAHAPGRLRVQYDSVVKASLTLHATCTANLVASAVSSFPVPVSYTSIAGTPVDPSQWASWIEFEQFGSAGYDTTTDAAPADRGRIDKHFKVDFGERILASAFFLTLSDDSIVNAAIYDRPRPNQSMMGGTLGGDPTTRTADPTMGRFDFDLERGQSAQFFP